MFCPRCSEAKAAENTQFCTKCGFNLTGLHTFVESGGKRPDKRKGIEQGVKLIMLGVILIPVWMFIAPAFPANDRFIEGAPSTTWAEAIAWILMWVSFLAGAGRIAFALVFETAAAWSVAQSDRNVGETPENAALPSGESFQGVKPGKWKTTDELFEPVLRKPRTSGEL